MPAKRKAKDTQEQLSQKQPRTSETSRGKTRQQSRHADSKEAFENDDMERSVLGGLSGGYRITGDETTDPTITVFKVPFNDKFIICEMRVKNSTTSKSKRGKGKKSSDGAQDTARPKPALIFTHGAGGGISNPATASFAEGFSHVDPVVCFQGTMNLQSRVKTFHAMIEHENWGEALGGRSMGARAAVITANESEAGAVKALILVSYPLVGGGKGNKEDNVRDGILKELDADVDILFVIGDRDSMCDIEHLKEVREKMEATSWLVEVKGADHGMSLKNKKIVEQVREKTGAVAANWLKSRDRKKRYNFIAWDDDAAEVAGGDWLEDGG